MYIGTATALEKAQWHQLSEEKRKQVEAEGFEAWMRWGTANATAIVDQGTPLGKTKRVDGQGLADITN